MNSTPNAKSMFREIRDMIDGDVLYDDLSRTLYSSGACLYPDPGTHLTPRQVCGIKGA